MKKIMQELELILKMIFNFEQTIKIPTLTIIIRCVFQKGKKLYPQNYLDQCFYEL